MLLMIIQLLMLASPGYAAKLCHNDEHAALLAFKTTLTISDSSSFDNCEGAYPKIESWGNGSHNNECCYWDGISCDLSSGHVTELDLSCNLLTGGFRSVSSLFRLRHLHHINLAFNNFSDARISPGFGRLSNLKYLNLSASGFNGDVPREIGWLSRLTALDLSGLTVNMSDFKVIIANLTYLRVLNLSNVIIGTDLPPMIANLSKLTSLSLTNCDLQGGFPMTGVLSLPELRVLELGGNPYMYGEFSMEHWRSPLEIIDFQDCNFVGKLPNSIGGSSNSSSLRSFNIAGCRFEGRLPSWTWNVTEKIKVNLNYKLAGSLPTSVNMTTLARLSSLNVAINLMTGNIPAWVFALPSLKILYVYDNLFTGIDEFVNASSSLLGFKAHDNQLQGHIPEAVFELRSLQDLILIWNKLRGTIPQSKLYKLPSLNYLGLGGNNLSVVDDLDAHHSLTSWPNLQYVQLESCNLSHFPDFLRGRENLTMLTLSHNDIRGEVPEWVFEISKTCLETLDLSFNSLTGRLIHFPWQKIGIIDIRSNMFEGVIPVPSPSITYLRASNNRFTGELPPFVCHLVLLQVLDLSHNNFTGTIPNCLAYPMSNSLFLLDLMGNQLHGVIPSIIFQDCLLLSTLSLGDNLLEGTIPQSLNNCTNLHFLDLGKNKLTGTFPHWLIQLTDLVVLILGSNKLQGHLFNPDGPMSIFLNLQILDISNNYFTGELPIDLLASFQAMQVISNAPYEPPYEHQNFYYSSIIARFKGLDRQLDKIRVDLVLIDASDNLLEGPIPDAIGYLVSIRWLNLAHNNFTGNIPPSLGNLTLLESLDLSSNKLDGQIPGELLNLNSLQFFNVSENNLVGPVPTGKQFNTLLDNSYLGNPGLCGEFLIKKCRKLDKASNPAADQENNDESSGVYVWEIALMGYGCGIFVGIAWGYLIFWQKTPYWLDTLILKIQVYIMLYQRRCSQKRRSSCNYFWSE